MAKRPKRIQASWRRVEPPRTASASDFAPDYAYVRADLRRIAFLAAGFVALLALLSVLLD